MRKVQRRSWQLVPVVDVEKAKEYYQTALNELGVDSVSFSMIADDTDAAMLNSAFIQEQLKVNLELTLLLKPCLSRQT